MDRRTFVKASVVTAASAAGVLASRQEARGEPGAGRTPAAAELKLSSQISRLPGKSVKEKVENLVQYGGVGLELHPGFNVKEVREAIEGTPVKISAICAADGPYIVDDQAQRRKAVDNAKKLLELGGELGSTGVIMVPAFNNAKGQLAGMEAHKVLVELLHEMGEHGVKYNCRMLMEPLNRGEAWFLRHLAYAASICKEVNSPGVAMMGDFYHMNIEEPNDQGAFVSARDHVHHVHLASTKRNLPGQDERSFVDGFKGLQAIGYRDYLSLECGVKGDPVVEIPKSFAFLRRQWEETAA
jgi:sugar phosphate isomerase/epimerase